MKIRKILFKAMLATVLIFGLMACASSTKLVKQWNNPAYTGKPFKRILVLAAFNDDIQRRSYEQTFVERITRNGVIGIAGNSLIEDVEDYGSKSKIREAVKKSSADAVLLAKQISVKKIKREISRRFNYSPHFGPGYDYNYYGYYGREFNTIYTPGYYIIEDTVVTLETTVNDSETDKTVWAGGTRSFNPSSDEKMVAENADLILKSMRKSGLLTLP